MNHRSYQLVTLVTLSIIATLLFSGCSGMLPTGAASPEAAAVQYAQQMKLANFSINHDSVQATQTVELTNRVLVMIQYTGTRIPGGAETCQFVMDNDKARFFGWESHGGAGSCHANNDPTDIEPITTGGSRGAGATPSDQGYSSIYGDVRDEQITSLLVTWSDGMVQTVDVQSGAFLAARDGQFDMQKIEALNDQGATIYTLDPKAPREKK